MSDCGRWSRLLKKRELLAYYVLCSEDSRKWNIGEAVDVLVKTLFFNRKTAYSIIRRLRRMGLLVREDHVTYECIGFQKYIEELLRNYVCRKKQRLLR